MNSNNDDIIPKLKFISRLSKGDKINVKNMYIQQNNFYNWISRSFFNIDDRANTLMFVHTTVKRGFDLLLHHIDSSNPFDIILCQNLYQDLRNTKIGFLNLRETYVDDVMFTCRIDALVEETDAKLSELETKHRFLIARNDKNDDRKEDRNKYEDCGGDKNEKNDNNERNDKNNERNDKNDKNNERNDKNNEKNEKNEKKK